MTGFYAWRGLEKFVASVHFAPPPQENRGDPKLRGRRCRRYHVDGQCELKCRAAFRIGTRPQTAPMGLDNPPTDGKSYAGALLFGGEEGLENTIGFPHGKADA